MWHLEETEIMILGQASGKLNFETELPKGLLDYAKIYWLLFAMSAQP